MMNFSSELILWYKEHERLLPWRKTKDPYSIWISEIILQQTRVAQGLSYYKRFKIAFPTVKDLALASEDQVLKLWEGLGYYSRARNMHFAAKNIWFDLKGDFPDNYNELIKLKGIGPYTAAAISSICYNEHKTVVDGNVYRVLSRLFGIHTPINSTIGKKQFEELAHSLNTGKDHGTFNQALMEFGALHCTPKQAKCDSCIFLDQCVAYQTGKVNELPVKEKKLKVKTRHLSFILIIDKSQETYIQRREGKGIWEGLFQFPLFETLNQAPLEEILNTPDILNITAGSDVEIVNSSSLIHKLTHQTLHINIHNIKINKLPPSKDYRKVPVSELINYAFPKPLSDIVSQITKQ